LSWGNASVSRLGPASKVLTSPSVNSLLILEHFGEPAKVELWGPLHMVDGLQNRDPPFRGR
jgi:hypothetical protein